MTMTSTAGSASSRRRPVDDRGAPPCGPWTAQLCISNRTAGQRRRAVTRTSRSAALSRPVMTPTTAGRERQRPLADGVEQALGGQQLPDPLDAGQQLAEADGADLGGAQREGPAGDVVVGPGADDHAGALGELQPGTVGDVAVAGDRHRQVGRRVAQGQEDRGRAAAPRQLGDLALDPHLAEPADPVGDLAGDRADRPRRLGGRRCGHVAEGAMAPPTAPPCSAGPSGLRQAPRGASGLDSTACSSSFSSRLRSILR